MPWQIKNKARDAYPYLHHTCSILLNFFDISKYPLSGSDFEEPMNHGGFSKSAHKNDK